MRRRSHLAVAFVALAAVGWNVVTTQPSGSALAADPQARARNEPARSSPMRGRAQQALAATLDRQRAELASAPGASPPSSTPRSTSRAPSSPPSPPSTSASASSSARSRDQVDRRSRRTSPSCKRQIAVAQPPSSASWPTRSSGERRGDLGDREDLLEEHLRSAYERGRRPRCSRSSCHADSLDEITTQFGYLTTVSDQDAILADEIRSIRDELATRRESLKRGAECPRRCARARPARRRNGSRLAAPSCPSSRTPSPSCRLKRMTKRAEQESALNASLAVGG